MIKHISRTAPVLVLVACASAGADPPAVMFRGNPEHAGTSNARFFAGQGGVKWQVQTGGAVRSSPAVTDTRVFVGSADGNLYALDRTHGRTVWSFGAGGAGGAAPGAPPAAAGRAARAWPAVASGLVVAATLAGRIFAVEESSGRLRWSLSTGPAL